MKHAIAILGIIFLMVVWFIPCYMMAQPDCGNGWGMLYIPIVIITFLWGWALNNTYFENY